MHVQQCTSGGGGVPEPHVSQGHRDLSVPSCAHAFSAGANMDVGVQVTRGRGHSDSDWQVLGQVHTRS